MLRTQISLTPEDRSLLDEEAARTGRSISSLIRHAVTATYSRESDLKADLSAIDAAFGTWTSLDVDGEAYVERLRSGDRLREAAKR